MSFVALNGYDVEYASSRLVYENLFPEIKHINGKGCIDTYTATSDVLNVNKIDVMRVLPYAPRFRKLGATNNGAFHTKRMRAVTAMRRSLLITLSPSTLSTTRVLQSVRRRTIQTPSTCSRLYLRSSSKSQVFPSTS